MKLIKSWRWLLKKKNVLFEAVWLWSFTLSLSCIKIQLSCILELLVGIKFLWYKIMLQGKCGFKMKQLPFMGIVCTVMLFIVYRTTNYQHKQTEVYWPNQSIWIFDLSLMSIMHNSKKFLSWPSVCLSESFDTSVHLSSWTTFAFNWSNPIALKWS